MNVTCLWTDWNVDKLAQHDVTPEEFEEAVARPYRQTYSHSSDRPAVVAYVRGRKPFCVFDWIDSDTILPRTAYEID